MKVHFSALLMTAFVVSTAFSQTKVSISGTVKDKSGLPIENAVARLESLGYVSITDQQGNFKIDNTSPVLHRGTKQDGISVPFVKSNILFFTSEALSKLSFKVYSLQGRLCKSIDAGEIDRGSYNVNLQSLLSGNLGRGTFIVKGVVGKQHFSASLTKTSSRPVPFAVQSISNIPSMKKTAQAGAVDRLIITKLGMAPVIVDLDSYETVVGNIEVTKSFDLNSVEVINSVEDSLVELLIERIEQIESIEGPDELKAIDFISIKTGFEALLGVDSTRFTSNVGFMLSSIMSLNTNQKIWKLVDSIESWVEDVDDYYTYDNEPVAPRNGLLKKAMKKGGVLSLGKAMVSQTPDIITGMVQKPSFPKFITLSYIQGTIETELLPTIDKVIATAARIEGLQTDAMKINVEGDTYELDKGEVYLFDAFMHLLRAYARMYCTYNMDMFSSAADLSYSWIDSIIINSDDRKNIISVKGDTLFHIYRYDDSKEFTTFFKTFKYNLEQRPQFMTIRKQNHEGVLADLQLVPQKVKTGMNSIRNETDDQDDDLLKISDILSNDEDMLDFSQEMIEEGLSQSFAQNFSTVERLADFITKLLSGPYTFDETIDDKKITLTINLSSFFTNPVTDLRSLLPKYTWVDEASWSTADMSRDEYDSWNYSVRWNSSTQKYDTVYYFYTYDDDSLVIDRSLIDSITTLSWSTCYYLSHPIRHTVTIDSNYFVEPIRLVDDSGKPITYDEIEDLIDNKTFFPYFKDYTINGLFPDMTRQKWLDLIYDK